MFKNFLGVIWSAPLSIPVWILCFFLNLFGQVAKVTWNSDLTLTWCFREDRWFYRKLFRERGWLGFGWGNNILVGAATLKSEQHIDRTLKHEAKHCYQQYRWGIAFPLAYILHSVYIFVFISEKHSYYDNCFEREARGYAGQRVDIPREQWAQGPTDRWAWW